MHSITSALNVFWEANKSSLFLILSDSPILQFGKFKKGIYNLDFKFPLANIQAFGIALSMFAWKKKDT